MVCILIIQKTGIISELNVREFNTSELYKKCGFKKDTDFNIHTSWGNNKSKYPFDRIDVWARDTGKANTENKYDFPPPIDTKLFFGSCALVAYNDNKPINLSSDIWTKYYEHLFGGFEDLTALVNEDENEIDELENIAQSLKTKHGYLKDGFVVDDNDSELSYEEYEYSDEEN